MTVARLAVKERRVRRAHRKQAWRMLNLNVGLEDFGEVSVCYPPHQRRHVTVSLRFMRGGRGAQ